MQKGGLIICAISFMKKMLILLVVFMWIGLTSVAQKLPETDSLPFNTDSLEKEVDAFLSMLDSLRAPKSYWQVGIGVSNSQFSVSNMALNAQQTNSRLTFTPSITYNDKSGFSLAYTNYFLVGGGQSGIMQHGITPGYDFSKKKAFDFGIYYTRFIGNNNFESNTSPYKNDLYSYAEYNKWEVKPSVAVGYSTGKFTETSKTDSFIVLNRPFPRPDTTIRFSIYDTLNIRLRDVSVTASFRHKFTFNGKKQSVYYTLTPSFLVFFAANSYDVEYKSVSVLSPRTELFLQDRPFLRDQVLKLFHERFPNLNQSRNFLNSTGFAMQSLGLSIDAAGYFGKFYVSPRLYMDYYLLSSENKFRAIFSLQAGFMF